MGLGSSRELTWEDVPVERDGLVLAHNALRLDVADFTAAVEAVVKNGDLAGWRLKRLRSYWEHFVVTLTAHHDHEEECFFPKYQERFDVPKRLNEDHHTLIKAMDAVTARVRKLSEESLSKEHAKEEITQLQSEIATFSTVMNNHLEDEEKSLIGPTRQHFTHAEVEAIVQSFIKKMEWFALPEYLRPMTREDKTKWMTESKIPWLIQIWVMLPRCARYEKEFIVPLKQVHDANPPT